jgi:predicted RNA binding protein YcfA (HicA-like mRNA interferase family)
MLIKISIQDWLIIGQKAGWIKKSSVVGYISSKEYIRRLEAIKWTFLKQKDSHVFYVSPTGKNKVVFSTNHSNWEQHWAKQKQDLRKISEDLEFVFKNPFEIPKYYNFETLKVEPPFKKFIEKKVSFLELAKFKDFEIFIDNKWVKPNHIDFSSFEIMFLEKEDIKVKQFNPNTVLIVKYEQKN